MATTWETASQRLHIQSHQLMQSCPLILMLQAACLIQLQTIDIDHIPEGQVNSWKIHRQSPRATIHLLVSHMCTKSHKVVIILEIKTKTGPCTYYIPVPSIVFAKLALVPRLSLLKSANNAFCPKKNLYNHLAALILFPLGHYDLCPSYTWWRTMDQRESICACARTQIHPF